MSTYRAIATDLDGTLLGSDGRVSARTRAAVLTAEDRGLQVVIATGRPPRWIPPIVEQLGERGLVVCANGAAVYDPAAHELVHRTELEPEVLGSIVDDVTEAFPQAVIGLEQGFDFAIDEAIRDTDVVERSGAADGELLVELQGELTRLGAEFSGGSLVASRGGSGPADAVWSLLQNADMVLEQKLTAARGCIAALEARRRGMITSA